MLCCYFVLKDDCNEQVMNKKILHAFYNYLIVTLYVHPRDHSVRWWLIVALLSALLAEQLHLQSYICLFSANSFKSYITLLQTL